MQRPRLGSVAGLHSEVGQVQRFRHNQREQQARDRRDPLLDPAGGSVGDHRVRHGLAGVRSHIVRVANKKMEETEKERIWKKRRRKETKRRKIQRNRESEKVFSFFVFDFEFFQFNFFLIIFIFLLIKMLTCY